MDELLDLMEENFDDGDGFGESPYDDTVKKSNISSSSRTSFSSPKSKSSKENTSLTFKDVFGSPDKRDVKDFGLSSSSSTAGRGSSQSRLVISDAISPAQLQLSKAIRLDDKVPFKTENAIVIDPFSRVRIFKSSLSIAFDEHVTAETVLKERNIGLEFVSLLSFPAWQRGKGKDAKNFWISACLTRKTPGVRKSANGNEYAIWELNDLKDLDKKVTIFLFGAASSPANIKSLPVGSLVDITTPSVMQDTSNSGAVKLCVNNASQIRFIGTAKDFGFCQAKKKNGDKCTAVVNTWECSYCVHHASGELKKLSIGNGKRSKGKSGKTPGSSLFPNKSFGGGESLESLKQQGIVVSNFGMSPSNQSFCGSSSNSKPKPVMPPSTRMALQGSSNEMSKNPIKFGNPETVNFGNNERNHILLKNEKPIPLPARKPLDLNPTKTRHLTDKDRMLLQMLDTEASKSPASDTPSSNKSEKISQPSKTGNKGVVVSDLITTSIVNNPNAASRNFLQFLSLKHAPQDQVDLASNQKSTSVQPLIMSREKVKSMAKALDFVKKNGPIKKSDPNGVSSKKRKIQQLSGGESKASNIAGPSTKKRAVCSKTQIDVEFDFNSEEFKRILNAKSAHDDELDEIQHEEYFNKLEKKEALENKLLSVYSIETNAVMCRQCKYVALSQSDFCKEQMHDVRLVKARKRFFKCKDCGNRTMSLDKLPKRPCSNCNSSSWLVAPVGKERKGPTLPSEMLAIRGNEEKFIGSAGTKMFLHLEA